MIIALCVARPKGNAMRYTMGTRSVKSVIANDNTKIDSVTTEIINDISHSCVVTSAAVNHIIKGKNVPAARQTDNNAATKECFIEVA